MSEQIDRVADLGLVLDHGRHRVARGNQFVDLGGECRLWDILAELARRYDKYLPTRDLRENVWSDLIVEDTTLWAAISTLRTRLHPLGITIKCKKRLGYRLEMISDC